MSGYNNLINYKLLSAKKKDNFVYQPTNGEKTDEQKPPCTYYAVFTLTETNKMATVVPNGISVSLQCEHPHNCVRVIFYWSRCILVWMLPESNLVVVVVGRGGRTWNISDHLFDNLLSGRQRHVPQLSRWFQNFYYYWADTFAIRKCWRQQNHFLCVYLSRSLACSQILNPDTRKLPS